MGAFQVGVVMLKKVVEDKNVIGARAEAMASSEGPLGNLAGRKTRSTLPLPMPANCRQLLQEVIDEKKGTRCHRAPTADRWS